MKIEINISDLEEKILRNDILDIEEWLNAAIRGKINNCKKRALIRAQKELFQDEDITEMPATEKGLLELWFSRPYYKAREDESYGS